MSEFESHPAIASIEAALQERQAVTRKLEERYQELLAAGEIVEPDIADQEAIKLIDRCNRQGVPLTQELLGNRALRLTQGQLSQIAEDDGWLEWFKEEEWRNSFVHRGEITSATEGMVTAFTILFPRDLGTIDQYQKARNALDIWLDPSLLPEFNEVIASADDEAGQRQNLLSYLGQ